MKGIHIFCMLSFILLCAKTDRLFAKAPTTPKILFTSTRDGNREVYSMNPDGSEQVPLTQHPAEDLEAVWSPTGEQILFVSDRDGVRDLYLMDPDGANVRRVFKKETYRESPTWSPDGRQIAYVHINWAKLIFTIYIASLAEQEEDRFVEGIAPAWSPDAAEIAYSVGGRVTLINIRPRVPKRLLPKKAMFWQKHPSWSGRGDKLAFSWNKNPLPPDHKLGVDRVPREWAEKETIYIINRDGTALKQLVEEAGSKVQYPALSPSGDEVLYTWETKGFQQVFKVDVNNSVQTQLTHVVGLSLRQANTGGDWFDPAFALPVSPQPQLLTTTWAGVKKK